MEPPSQTPSRDKSCETPTWSSNPFRKPLTEPRAGSSQKCEDEGLWSLVGGERGRKQKREETCRGQKEVQLEPSGNLHAPSLTHTELCDQPPQQRNKNSKR
ncbi:unnamed protein product [Pleuronectes platessa]|uniref:Uncharacterized protein n=1 Tax=Pleuronectes platessa TaxID=8262 RepID=A0A9N7VPD5_PLEPL|nr:unnamed protein product [Pleuronectes platessa]